MVYVLVTPINYAYNKKDIKVRTEFLFYKL